MLKPRLIDIHSHLNFSAFDNDREAVLERMKGLGVLSIVVGTDKKTSVEAVALADKHPLLFASVGLHPTDSSEDFDYNFYKNLAQNPRVVIIGECGLDYAAFVCERSERLQKRASAEAGSEGRLSLEEIERRKQKQKTAFIRQIELALKLDKPLMIHCRDAYEDVWRILNSYFLIHNSRLRANMHFFAGDWKIAEKFLDLGFYLSFTGVITFAKQYDEIIKKMPLNRLMIETDAPFVAPVPHRGKRNEPIYVEDVAKKIAVLRGVSFEKIAGITVRNAKKFFSI